MTTLAELRAIANGETVNEAVHINAYPRGKVDVEEVLRRGDACNNYIKSHLSNYGRLLRNLISLVESQAKLKDFVSDPMFKLLTPKYPKWQANDLITTKPNFGTNMTTGNANYGSKLLDIAVPAYYFNILDADMSRFKARGYDEKLIKDVYHSIVIGFGQDVQRSCKADGLNVVYGNIRNTAVPQNSEKGIYSICISYNEAKKLCKALSK